MPASDRCIIRVSIANSLVGLSATALLGQKRAVAVHQFSLRLGRAAALAAIGILSADHMVEGGLEVVHRGFLGAEFRSMARQAAVDRAATAESVIGAPMFIAIDLLDDTGLSTAKATFKKVQPNVVAVLSSVF